MKIVTEHIPEETSVTLILSRIERQKLVDAIENNISVFVDIRQTRREKEDINIIDAFLLEILKQIKNPKPKENGDKQGDQEYSEGI